MKADIIIRAKGGRDLVNACQASIRAATDASDFRIILVDDGSEEPLDSNWADLFVRHEESRGAVSATNSGLALSLQQTDSDYVIVMDNDTRIPDGDTEWLNRWIAELEQYPDCAAMGATTNFANPPQHILTVPQTYTGDWENGLAENIPVIWFISFAVMLRKSVVRQVGLWDERFNPGNWEDTDYAVQLRTAGYTVRVARSVYIHHDGHTTFGADLKRLLNENKIKFMDKWGVGRMWDMGFVRDEEITGILRHKHKTQPKA